MPATVTVSVHIVPFVDEPSPYEMASFLPGISTEVDETVGSYFVCVLHAAAVQLTEGIQRSADLQEDVSASSSEVPRENQLTQCQSR